TSSSDDSAAFAFHLNGHNVKLHSQGKSIQLSACLADHIALIKQSQWTREHFSTGAYIDEQGCASLRAEVNFGVRVTKRWGWMIEVGIWQPGSRTVQALRELGIGSILAYSPQAKGRMERSFLTAQDRLVKHLRLAKVSTLGAANGFRKPSLGRSGTRNSPGQSRIFPISIVR